ncbi:glycine betaine/L-proline ABC transporter ATP-binding protein [Clostridium sporogenes]|uniref:Quaternary amine transport ATP-binding protein n=1 Tax=Clostridium cochlearium TaxID=1494 RepID=A0A2X2Y561_CLOCO|nr:glycine betaine/L-proline ABC transporter ATP-binding protein [Clostridium cochlearium]MBE6064498.1 glycine betaine/L-proline ABC transporter ATP-binding protein [Clostridium cochlearium]MBU5269530.1 glycine betaine/L-proline ABC transporter ATP-binding protein [Clostridium cochlearium]MDU1443034.1 glycine betaine/L-proline ABC transporter ATP-binding protein [Clostridium cochlearium]SQB33099.1 glycine betaine transport ATP-binding protein [Clostridium cochlearium]
MEEIEVQNLVKVFGKPNQKCKNMISKGYSKNQVLEKTGLTVGINKVSFNIKKNEIFVIMGLSGSGKSTLLRCLNRLIEPTEGRVIVDGKDITKLDKKSLRKLRKEKFAMVFQNFGLFPHRTILENTMLGIETHKGMTKDEKIQKSTKALEQVGLSGWENKYPNELSGGMQQRVGIARALAVESDILLMDEPFSALDPLIRKEMQDLLLDLYENMNKTIIFITHDLDEALRIGDRIAIMKDGKVVQIGTPEDILNNCKNDYVKEFVQNVNRSQILKAKDVMIKPLELLYENDGIKTAKYKMKKNHLTSIFVVEGKRKYKGIVRLEDILDVNGDENISDFIKPTLITEPEKTIDELFGYMASLDVPIPVIDNENTLKGIIIKGTVLSNLAGRDV